MLSVIGIWEPGFTEGQTFFEWRMWKQTVGAFRVDRWCMVGSQVPGGGYERFASVPEALGAVAGRRVFLIPGHGIEVSALEWPEDVVLVLGNASENLRRFVQQGDTVAKITTPEPIDLFGVVALGMALNER